MDKSSLILTLSSEIQKATTSAVIHIVQEGLLSVVCKLRGISDYGVESKREIEKLKVRLFGE